MVKIKVYYVYKSENNDGHYTEDNPDADYPNEIYISPTWSSHLVIKEMDFKDIKKAFDDEDGDCDFSNTIAFITDSNDKIIFNPQTCDNRKRAEEYLIEKAKYEIKGGK